MRFILPALLCFIPILTQAQKQDPAAGRWADSVYRSLTREERIGQLIITRLSSMDMRTRKITFLNERVDSLIRRYNIGGVCVFQGDPVIQARMLNRIKNTAKTPVMVSIDGEWGVGQRLLDSVLPLPRQMMLGAVSDSSLLYDYGAVVARQCLRMGIQYNFAPVMDVNNNPDNPVINDRSFGENRDKVATHGIQYMKGMQDHGVLACAKHFPGHGDVAVDSHLDLPVILKPRSALDSMELYPFRRIFREQVGSVMIGHLYIPSIDSTPNRPTSLSASNIRGLLRSELGYEGLAVTDGLEMQGVKKFYPDGQASLQSILAGNDLLCLPDNIPEVVATLSEALDNGLLPESELEWHCKRVLMAKYNYVLPHAGPIDTVSLIADLNREVPGMRRRVAEKAITLLASEDKSFFPMDTLALKGRIAYLGVGLRSDNALTRQLRDHYQAGIHFWDFNRKDSTAMNRLLDSLSSRYARVIIGIHQLNRAPANRFGMSELSIRLIRRVQERTRCLLLLFGNAYAAEPFCYSRNLVLAYEDDSIVQRTTLDLLEGRLPFSGKLPVTICDRFPSGFGGVAASGLLPSDGRFASTIMQIDSAVEAAILRKAMPGCVVLAAKDGRLLMEKGYGGYTYERRQVPDRNSVYDLASLTKVLSTTLCIMKLADQGRLDLKKKLGDYLPSARGTDKADLTLEKLLLHEAGLKPFIPFYKETLDLQGRPLDRCYARLNVDCFSSPVANYLMLRNDLVDTFYHRLLHSEPGTPDTYVYSDIDFILLGKVVEALTGESLDEFAENTFYGPMGLESMCFRPLNRMAQDRIVPSTIEQSFRQQELRGHVHDQGAAILGGVAGHAGLFANAYDIACVFQMLLNKGVWNGQRWLSESVVDQFTAYQRPNSRRGLGFDKPEKPNPAQPTRKEPYPAPGVSPDTFGHTGFTGTCAWADPQQGLIFVFLSNRLYPEDNGVFREMNLRSSIFGLICQSLTSSPLP